MTTPTIRQNLLELQERAEDLPEGFREIYLLQLKLIAQLVGYTSAVKMEVEAIKEAL